MVDVATDKTEPDTTLSSLVATLQAENAQIRLESSTQVAELSKAVAALREQNEVLLRRLYGNKTERQNTNEAQLAFAGLLADKQALQRELDAALAKASADISTDVPDGSSDEPKPPRRGGGRRKVWRKP